MARLKTFLLIFPVFFLLILGYLHPITAMAQDLGRHFLTGRIIFETQQIPKTNLFSYTYPDFPFINHHWLSEVIFYVVTQLGGFNLLLVFTTIIVVTAFALVFFSSFKKENIISLTIASLLYFRVLFERTEVRPEIFSFLFLSIFIVILYRYREKFTPLIFILPFIELLWVNTHIYFPIGIAVLGLFFIDRAVALFRKMEAAVDVLKGKREEPTKFSLFAWRKGSECGTRKFSWATSALALLFITIVSVLILVFNPNGLTGALYPFKVFENYGYTIEENQNVFFLWSYFNGKTTILFFFISSILLFLTLIFSWKKTRMIDWLLAIFFTVLGITAERNFPLFVFGTFPIFVHNLSNVFDRFSFSNKMKNILLLSIFILLIWQIAEVFLTKPVGFGVEKGAEKAVNFILKNNLKGPIFNNFDIGSYLEYRLYPQEKVFVDGRPEAYPASFFQNQYIPMQEDKEVFKKKSEKYQFQTIFFAHTDQTPWAEKFMRFILTDQKWQLIYADDFVMILIKNKKEHLSDYLHVPPFKTLNIKSLFRLAHFFNVAGFVDEEISTYQAILAKNPNSCSVLYNLAVLLEQKQSPLSSFYTNTFNRSCQ